MKFDSDSFFLLGRNVENQLRSIGMVIRADLVMTNSGPEIMIVPEKRWRNMLLKSRGGGYRLRNTKLYG